MYIFESAGEMQLVGVAHLRRDFPDGLFGFLEQLGGASHAVVQQIFLRAFAHRIPENFAEIAAVQPADSGDVLDGNIILVVLVDEAQRLPHVEIPQPPLAKIAPGGGAGRQLFQKQEPMADEVNGVGVAVVDNVQHFVLQTLSRLPARRSVHRLCAADARRLNAFVGAQAVKFQPGVFPRLLLVGAVGGDLPRHDEKSLPGADVVHLLVGKQFALAGNDIMEQVMVSDMWAVGMAGVGALQPNW